LPFPFVFEAVGRHLVDHANRLTVRLESAPEYNISAAVEAMRADNGATVPDCPFFEFHFGSQLYELLDSFAIRYAKRDNAFEMQFPGRTAELVDALAPMLGDFFVEQHKPNFSLRIEPVPPALRAALIRQGSYFSGRDDRTFKPV
jgi:hypothetical protein